MAHLSRGRSEKGSSLLEVETDKVALEIPSPAAGSLVEIFIQEGETVPVGTLLARLDNSEQHHGNGATSQVAKASHDFGQAVTADSRSSFAAVRQLASENGVDLTKISGSGAGGRITKKDVLEFIAKHEKSVRVAMGLHSGEIGSDNFLTTRRNSPSHAYATDHCRTHGA